MRAAVYDRYGSPEVVQIRDVPKPSPRANEVLVRVHATTVTRGDSRIRGSVMPSLLEYVMGRLFLGVFKPRRKILGFELAGEISEVGGNVTKFSIGDKVFASTYSGFKFGAHTEYVALSENGIIALMPSEMSYEEAAPLPSGGAAALVYLRDTGNVASRETVLINGASGTLGTFGIQIAKYFGAEVTGVCSTRNVELVKSIGADHVIDYTMEDFTKSDQKYDLIFDAMSLSSKEACKDILASGGDYIRTSGPEPGVKELEFLREMVEDGHLKSVIDRRYPLDEIVEAHRYVDTGRKRGNVIIAVVED